VEVSLVDLQGGDFSSQIDDELLQLEEGWFLADSPWWWWWWNQMAQG
jgi:hypothetical protein